ncbi:hypothetical protein [Streptomyces sp. NRRL F-5135]|uniref:hypothetical protein n=1 Tax=Streptomyces sp. NRRL F-5135 TaxID=1463858 RepID=UPI00131D1E38|nr:hypothetical protein [Streptomyces sp. NRRL F-5135]
MSATLSAALVFGATTAAAASPHSPLPSPKPSTSASGTTVSNTSVSLHEIGSLDDAATVLTPFANLLNEVFKAPGGALSAIKIDKHAKELAAVVEALENSKNSKDSKHSKAVADADASGTVTSTSAGSSASGRIGKDGKITPITLSSDEVATLKRTADRVLRAAGKSAGQDAVQGAAADDRALTGAAHDVTAEADDPWTELLKFIIKILQKAGIPVPNLPASTVGTTGTTGAR